MRLYLSSYQNGHNPEELLRLAHGDTSMAVIMNAKDMIDPERRNFRRAEEMERLTSIGFNPTELDLRDYFSKTDDLRKKLTEFGTLWVVGGNVFVLRKAFAASGLDTFLKDMIANDELVYAGYSAGVCILSPTLKGIELCDDISLAEQYLPELELIWDGLGILPYSVAPHYKSDHPESASIDRVVAYFESHHMPYRTLRDGQTIVINS